MKRLPISSIANKLHHASFSRSQIGLASSQRGDGNDKIRYEDLVANVETRSTRALTIGTTVHGKIRRFFKETGGNLRNDDKKTVQFVLQRIAEEVEEMEVVERNPEITRIVDRTMATFRRFWETKRGAWRVDSVERHISFTLRNGIVLTGIYDALFYDTKSGGYVLVDWKTATTRGEIGTNLAQYKVQLNFYRFVLAFTRPNVYIERMYLVLLTENDWIEYEVELYVDRTIELIKEIEAIENVEKKNDVFNARGRGGRGVGRRESSAPDDDDDEKIVQKKTSARSNTIGELGYVRKKTRSSSDTIGGSGYFLVDSHR